MTTSSCTGENFVDVPEALPPGTTRRLAYLQENQMHFTTPAIFATNRPWPVKQLSELSWKILGAGRVSTTFSDFAKLLEGRGFICTLIERLADRAEPPVGLEQVIGATGNY